MIIRIWLLASLCFVLIGGNCTPPAPPPTFVLAGQSNMVGRSTMPPVFTTPSPEGLFPAPITPRTTGSSLKSLELVSSVQCVQRGGGCVGTALNEARATAPAPTVLAPQAMAALNSEPT